MAHADSNYVTSDSTPIIPDCKSRPSYSGTRPIQAYKVIVDHIPVPFLLAVGGLLCLGLQHTPYAPAHAAYFATAFVLAFYPLRALLTHLGALPNGRLQGIVEGRCKALIPGSDERGANPEFCVVLLSARSNAPLGLVDPRFKWVGDSFNGMMQGLREDRDAGLMNAELFISCQRRHGNTLMNVMYFQSPEHMYRWARRGLHQSAWMVVARNPEKFRDIELAHEVFTVKAGSFDAVYVNAARHGAGELYDFVPGPGGGDEDGVWRSTVRGMGSYRNRDKRE